MNQPVRLAWAVSGQGRALQAVLDAIDAGLIDIEPALIIVDRPSVIEKVAAERNVPCYLIAPGLGDYHPLLAEALSKHRCDWLGLTFNRLLSADVLDRLGGRIFNLHFSLLPMFPGFGSVAVTKTLASGMRMAGSTVHLIDETLDRGTILAQSACAVTAADTRATLGRRMFEQTLPMLLQIARSIGSRELQFDRQTGVSWPRADEAPMAPTHVFPLVDSDLVAFAEEFCKKLDT